MWVWAGPRRHYVVYIWTKHDAPRLSQSFIIRILVWSLFRPEEGVLCRYILQGFPFLFGGLWFFSLWLCRYTIHKTGVTDMNNFIKTIRNTAISNKHLPRSQNLLARGDLRHHLVNPFTLQRRQLRGSKESDLCEEGLVNGRVRVDIRRPDSWFGGLSLCHASWVTSRPPNACLTHSPPTPAHNGKRRAYKHRVSSVQGSCPL